MKEFKWFSEDVSIVEKKLNTNIREGLRENDAIKLIEKFGYNILTKQTKDSVLKRFFKQFDNVLIYVLIFAGIVAFVMQHYVDAYVVFGVIIINAIIGFIQENNAKNTLNGIKSMLSLDAKVKRDGKVKKVAAKYLVPGDIILLKAGDKVPADARVVSARQLKVQESMLTGESNAVEKNTQKIGEDALINEQSCMLFSSTLVTAGVCEAIVVKTGDVTEIGLINQMMTDVEKTETLLTKQIKVLVSI